ncbi:aminotransferase-like domain-containing protein [Marinivivus vitaminiproducens]|uniref:aminotransferase-like domain-containing protein n=1 Tax=Marinivivus vitaminiproducens TaxID=3035935 RepID=UPI00279E7489|nr:PLP-dependent aminotransferase family protein [Geminicoccaceae bacterium SCSIO 64248]
MSLPKVADLPRPRYRGLALALADAIRSGRLPAGSKLPPQRDLAYKLGVTTGTVMRAYALVAQEGLVAGEVGRGTFVQNDAIPFASDDPAAASLPQSDAMPGAPTGMPESDASARPVDLTRNAPAEVGQTQALADAMAALSRRPDDLLRLSGYPPIAGLPEHIEAARAWIAMLGIDVKPEQVMMTSGAHSGIGLALRALCRPGESILSEALTYSAIRGIGHGLRLRIEPVMLDKGGILPDALNTACHRTNARILFLQSTIHNPTTATLSAERRQAIAEIARRHDLLVIEDDVYGWLPEHRPPPLQSLIPERTIFLASASKSLMPGLRIGIVVTPPAMAARFSSAQYELHLGLPALTAEIFSLWMRDGTAVRLAAAQRAEARARQRIARDVLRNHAFAAHPDGLHLWLPIPEPWRAAEFAQAARAEGVALMGGGSFSVARSTSPNAVRLSLTGASDRDSLIQGLNLVVDMMERGPRLGSPVV